MADMITLRTYLDDLNDMLEHQSPTEVVSHCRYILQHFPQNVETYRLLATALLQKGNSEDRAEYFTEAAEVFRRVLSVLPNDYFAQLGLSKICEHEGTLDEAIWHLERAYEQIPGNQALQDALRELYIKRDGEEHGPDKIQLTRGALARQYVGGQLYDQALIELRDALEQFPDRIDLQVMLAETLWESHHPVEAGEVAVQILKQLPNCLSANRILARLWLDNERPTDAQVFLERLEVLDPYAAIEVLQVETETPDKNVLPRLDYGVRAQASLSQETPEWLQDLDDTGTMDMGNVFHEPSSDVSEREHGEVNQIDTDAQPEWVSQLEQESSDLEIPDFFVDKAVDLDVPSAENEPALSPETPSWFSEVLEAETGAAVAAENQLPVEGDWLDELPDVELELPDIELPDAKLELPALEELPSTELPDVRVDDASEGDWLEELPDVELQDVELESPAVELPSVELPDAPAADVSVTGWLDELPDAELELPDIELPDALLADVPEAGWLDEVGVAALGELPDVELELPDVELPDAPAADVSVTGWLDELPDVELQDVELELPDIELPDAKLELPALEELPSTELPDVRVDDASEGDWLEELPDVELQDVELESPAVELPSVELPDAPAADASVTGWLDELPDAELELPDIELPDALLADVPEADWLDEVGDVTQDELLDVELDLPALEELPDVELPDVRVDDASEGGWLDELPGVELQDVELELPEEVPVADVSVTGWLDEVGDVLGTDEQPSSGLTDLLAGIDAAHTVSEQVEEADSIPAEWVAAFEDDVTESTDVVAEVDAEFVVPTMDSALSDEVDEWLPEPDAELIEERQADAFDLSADGPAPSEDDSAVFSQSGAEAPVIEAWQPLEPSEEVRFSETEAGAKLDWVQQPSDDDRLDTFVESGEGAATELESGVLSDDQEPDDDVISDVADAEPAAYATLYVDEDTESREMGDWDDTDPARELDTIVEVSDNDRAAFDTVEEDLSDETLVSLDALPLVEDELAVEIEFGETDDFSAAAEDMQPLEDVSVPEDDDSPAWMDGLEIVAPVSSEDDLLDQLYDPFEGGDPDQVPQYHSTKQTGVLQPDESPDWMVAFTGEELSSEPEEAADMAVDFGETGVLGALGLDVTESAAIKPDAIDSLDDIEFENDLSAEHELDTDVPPVEEGAMPGWLVAITASEADKLDETLLVEQPDSEGDWLGADDIELEPSVDVSLEIDTVAADELDVSVEAMLDELESDEEDWVDAASVEAEVVDLELMIEDLESDSLVVEPIEIDLFEADILAAPVIDTETEVAQPDVLAHTKGVQIDAVTETLFDDDWADEFVPEDFSFDEFVPRWLRQPKENDLATQALPSVEISPDIPEWLRDVVEDEDFD